MNKILEVREFDSIIYNVDYKEDSNYKFLLKENFTNLANFIREINENEESEDILKFMSIGYKRNLGEFITIKNYVGLIQMNNGFQIQILPKISFINGEDINNRKTKKVFLRMLRSLKDFPSKVFNDASLNVDKMNLYELFINMYLQEVDHLVKKGIKSDYINKESNLHFYKGKLMVNEHFRTNIIHKERFYVSYEEFHPNRSENRIIKATLYKLQKLTTSFENSKRIRQLLTHFDFVEPSKNYDKDFSKIVINRTTKDYESLINWSKVFLMNKSFSTFSGSTVSRALLFPMESIFESYVAQEIKKILIPAGWEVSTQDKGHYLFSYPREQFALRPDIVIRKEEKTIVLDTKWKNLVNNQNKNYGIAQSDMYQMFAYSKKYKAKDIWLLYPLNDQMRYKDNIRFSSDDETNIHLHFVDLEDMIGSLEDLLNKLEVL